MFPVQLGHVPAGASSRQLTHYVQTMRGSDFRRYHYTPLQNLLVYGTAEAPHYDLSNVRAPVYLHYGASDMLTHIEDVKKLQSRIGGPTQFIRIPLDSFNHFDFLWGIDSKRLVYDKVIEIMKSYDQARQTGA